MSGVEQYNCTFCNVFVFVDDYVFVNDYGKCPEILKTLFHTILA